VEVEPTTKVINATHCLELSETCLECQRILFWWLGGNPDAAEHASFTHLFARIVAEHFLSCTLHLFI